MRTTATPLTAIRLPPIYTRTPLSPLVSTPMSAASQSSNLSLLDRYLIEAERIGTPISPPDELSKSALTRDIPETAIYAPFIPPSGSPPDTASEIFSPVLGEGPAEKWDAQDQIERWEVEDLRDKLLRSPEPVSPTGSDETFIEDDDEPSPAEQAPLCEAEATSGADIQHELRNEIHHGLQLDHVPQSSDVSDTIQVAAVPLTNEKSNHDVSAAKAPLVEENEAMIPQRRPSGPKQPMEIRSPGHNDALVGEAPPSAPTKDSFGIPLSVQLDSKLSPHFDPPPAPMSSTFKMTLPTFVDSHHSSHFDPPPAPKLAEFPLEFPPSPKFAGPAPIDTTQSVDQWRRLTISGAPRSAMDSPTVNETHFLSLASPMAPPPAPGPANLKFEVALPDSPVRSKPAPINTSAPMLSETVDWKCRSLSSATMSSGTPTPKFTSEPSTATKETTFMIAAPGKKAKTVRFALSDICKSPLPSSTFKIPVSPGFPNFSRHIPHESEFDMPTISPALSDQPARKASLTVADALLDPVQDTERRDGRSLFRRISPTLGRFGRSQSEGRGVLARRHSEPQTPRFDDSQITKASEIGDAAVDEQTTNGIPILPNTVYDPQKKQFFATNSQVKSEKYIILQAYFKPGFNKKKDIPLGSLNTSVSPAPVATRQDGSNPGDQSALPMSAESNSSESNPLWW